MKKNRKTILLISVLVLLLAAGLFAFASKAGRDSSAEEEEAIKKAVSQRALQCYVIEGTYPESLDYLIDNYGLAVNTEDYKIVYTPFAENLPPDIRVIRRND